MNHCKSLVEEQSHARKSDNRMLILNLIIHLAHRLNLDPAILLSNSTYLRWSSLGLLGRVMFHVAFLVVLVSGLCKSTTLASAGLGS